ncbi:MAG: hypothetical protein LBD36_03405 [Holosporales bacterium]|jgi:hypothetical protein|nr:hypothetical protein [Holosporales bacterium]
MAIIGTTLLAALSGIDSFLGIQEFVESHFDELSKMSMNFPKCLIFPEVSPTMTPTGVWSMISPDAFLRSVLCITNGFDEKEETRYYTSSLDLETEQLNETDAGKCYVSRSFVEVFV